VAALCQTETGELIDIIDDAVRDSDALKMFRKVWTPTLKLPCRMPWLITVRLNISTSSREVRADILVVKTTVAEVDKGLADLSPTFRRRSGI
jgi:hypothetical protein